MISFKHIYIEATLNWLNSFCVCIHLTTIIGEAIMIWMGLGASRGVVVGEGWKICKYSAYLCNSQKYFWKENMWISSVATLILGMWIETEVAQKFLSNVGIGWDYLGKGKGTQEELPTQWVLGSSLITSLPSLLMGCMWSRHWAQKN